MKTTVVSALAAASVLLGGCVGKLETRPNRDYTALQSAVSGVSYALPKMRYDVKLARTLTECPVGIVDGKPTALKFGVSAVAAPTLVAGESYTVNYEKLPGWLRTASFEIKLYPNGVLKSVGASAEDKTGDVLNAVAKTAFSLASVVGLSASDAAPLVKTPDTIVGCTDAAKALVAETRQIDKDLKTAAATLTGYEKDAERLRAAGTARLIDAVGKKRFLDLFDDIKTVEDEITGLKARKAEISQLLGVEEDIVWNGGVTAPDYARPYPLSPTQRAKLAKLLVSEKPPTDYPQDEAEGRRQTLMTSCYGGGATIDNCLNQQLNLRSGIYLERTLSNCAEDGADPDECGVEILASDPRYRAARDDRPDSGIFVREPMVGRLLFCREALLPVPPAPAPPPTPVGSRGGSDAQVAHAGSGAVGTAGGALEGGVTPKAPAAPEALEAGAAKAAPVCTVAQDEVKIAAGDFPQFGQLRYFPLRVGTFQAREMALTMTEAGRVESFTYKSTKAPAQGLAGSVADIAGQYDAYREKRETERRDDVKAERAEEIAVLQQDIDLLTKTAELKKLRTPAAVDPLKAVRDETVVEEAGLALARAKLKRLKTEAALAAYQ